MILFCPRCGAQMATMFRGAAFETSWTCSECGVASEPPGMLAPSDDEVTYGLDEWPVIDRAALTAALAADGLPYRWEAGVVLVVPEPLEAVVDGILDDLEGLSTEAADAEATEDEEPAGEDDVGGEDGGEDDGGGEDDAGEDEDEIPADGGEEAQAAMADLFVTADRLQRAPADKLLAGELAALAEVVAESLPPYGIEDLTWRRIQELTTDVEEAADDMEVADRARALRELLRPFV